MSVPTLHILCGKIASGKSTLAAQLAQSDDTVLLSEDAWLDALFADELKALPDYMRCAAKLRAAMAPNIVSLLKAGLSVVLDFQANTVESRRWMRGIINTSGVAHQLHLLNVPDEVCLARLRDRNAKGEHPFQVSDAQFCQVSGHFVPPSADEGFNVVRHGVD